MELSLENLNPSLGQRDRSVMFPDINGSTVTQTDKQRQVGKKIVIGALFIRPLPQLLLVGFSVPILFSRAGEPEPGVFLRLGAGAA